MSDNDHVDPTWLVGQIAQGVFDNDLAIIAEACEKRATLLDPTSLLADLVSISRELDSRKGDTLENLASSGVHLHTAVKRVLADAVGQPLVQEYAKTVARRVLVECFRIPQDRAGEVSDNMLAKA